METKLLLKRIEFTVEREKDGVLPFLDLFIQREKDSFITRVHRKDTHTQYYIHLKSKHSRAVKLGVLKGPIKFHRAHLLCDHDLKEDLLDELNLF